MTIILEAFANLAILTFVITSMLAIGLILLATAAGAPFLPKLVQVAKGNVAFGVGLMVLLMVATIIYLPLVMPLLLPGVTVNPMDIAGSLIVLMLIPLAIGLFINARYDDTAASLQPVMSQTSSISLILLAVLMLVLNFKNIIGVIGTGAIIAILIFIVVSFVLGYFLGGPGRDTKSGLGLGTGQRNLAAAMVVGSQNFDDPNVVIMIIVASVLMLFILMPIAGEIGKRSQAT